jgi:hypothetical protein
MRTPEFAASAPGARRAFFSEKARKIAIAFIIYSFEVRLNPDYQAVIRLT